MKRKYTMELLQVMQVFERTVHTPLKDSVILDDTFFFIVPEGMVGKAVGKGGINVKKLSQKLNRKVKIVEYSQDLKKFITNILHPLKVDDITEQEGVVTLHSASRETKGLIIGRSAKNLNTLKRLVARYFQDIVDIKVK